MVFLDKAKIVLDKASNAGKPIGCFISEIIVSSDGMVVPPEGYFQEIYKYELNKLFLIKLLLIILCNPSYRMIRSGGGVCIADECQTGMGRTGNFWAFQVYIAYSQYNKMKEAY